MTQKWIWQLRPKFITFFLLWILINDTNIICLSSKNMQFSKIRRLWLKNWACHAPLNLKLQRGVADSIFEPHPPDFEKICMSYRCSNDVNIIFWHSPKKFISLKSVIFFLIRNRPPLVIFYQGRPNLKWENHIFSI